MVSPGPPQTLRGLYLGRKRTLRHIVLAGTCQLASQARCWDRSLAVGVGRLLLKTLELGGKAACRRVGRRAAGDT
jgi:hypothetical protein